jgi:hypothetical protein
VFVIFPCFLLIFTYIGRLNIPLILLLYFLKTIMLSAIYMFLMNMVTFASYIGLLFLFLVDNWVMCLQGGSNEDA